MQNNKFLYTEFKLNFLFIRSDAGTLEHDDDNDNVTYT